VGSSTVPGDCLQELFSPMKIVLKPFSCFFPSNISVSSSISACVSVQHAFFQVIVDTQEAEIRMIAV
jgi:hypothetical protein